MPDSKTFAEQINAAQYRAMKEDDNMLCFGLGIDDPKAIFGTTQGLAESFGSERVFDMPTSENAMTGIGIGTALSGSRVLMTHQRVDFFLLAMDQLVNNAAKWHYMFNGQMAVPLTIRLIVGRGWGQGPTHAQSLQAWFSHIPGLKVVMPAFAADAQSMLYQSLMDNNPVVFLEHRWLHNQIVGDHAFAELSLEKARVVKQGKDVTMVASSYLSAEALRAAEALKLHGIEAEVIDLRSTHPLDWSTIMSSVEKTGRLLVMDTGVEQCSVASEVVAHVTQNAFSALKGAPRRLAMPMIPEPTSYGMTKDFYLNASTIAAAAHEMTANQPVLDLYQNLKPQGHHDVPGNYFKGPF